MIEKFRDWNPTSRINIKYKDNQGISGVWTTSTALLLQRIKNIIDEFSAENIKLTKRQLYYQLVGADYIPNAVAVYKRVCKFVSDACYGGHIDWDAIEDRGRTPSKHAEWDSVKDIVDSAVYSYRLPRWSDQDYYVELYCEKEAMESVLKPVADKYHIYFGANKGYSSSSTMYELAGRLKDAILEGKKVVVLYFGDHDPSGLDMVRDIRERLKEFVFSGENYIEEEPGMLEVEPLALNMQQVRQYNLPPNPAKQTDPRSKWYVEKYGETSWELDALKPQVLKKLAEDGILNFMDEDKYGAWIQREKHEKKALTDFAAQLSEEDDEDVE